MWVVIHCEYFPTTAPPCERPWIDEMVFHVAGSLRVAEEYVRIHQGMPYSWWKVERRAVDEADSNADDRPVTTFYNHRGTKRANPPHAWARKAFDKWQAEEALASD
ncbi:MAG: hypothetical protein KF708_13615 [Pirellulales bacterium]|nr:hypothetical protein [Pirellulales bacterium]